MGAVGTQEYEMAEVTTWKTKGLTCSLVVVEIVRLILFLAFGQAGFLWCNIKSFLHLHTDTHTHAHTQAYTHTPGHT